jgi:hypothetical protein
MNLCGDVAGHVPAWAACMGLCTSSTCFSYGAPGVLHDQDTSALQQLDSIAAIEVGVVHYWTLRGVLLAP